MNKPVPFVGYRSRSGRAVMYVKKGSRKEARCIQRGYEQV